MAFRAVVLISGEGTNLQALLDEVHGRDGIEIAGVASSREGARGLERARAAGIETAVFAAGAHTGREARDDALAGWIEARGADLVVLAGFMELLGAAFIRRFEGRIVNVHPSLLPAFPGVGAIEQALAYGVKVMGVTVHFVDEGVDSGPVLLQEAFVPEGDRAAIERQVHAVEHRLLPAAVRAIAQGRVRAATAHPRRIDVLP